MEQSGTLVNKNWSKKLVLFEFKAQINKQLEFEPFNITNDKVANQ
jgi:hypothetical protein